MTRPLRVVRGEPGLEPQEPDWREDATRQLSAMREELENGAHTDDQVDEALADLYRDPRTFVRFAFPALDALVGGMAPGTVHYLGAFSGTGKTTLATSQVNEWTDAGVKVAVLPLETQPKEFRTYLACHRLSKRGYSIAPGEVLTGDAMRRDDWPTLRDALHDEYERSREEERDRLWMPNGVDRIDAARLEQAARRAADFGAQVLIVDHVDHVESENDLQGFEASRQVNNRLLDVAKRYRLVVLATSQMNLQAVRQGDRLAKYAPPQEHHLMFPAIKLQNAFTIVGLFRPLRRPRPGETAEQWQEGLTAAKRPESDPTLMLEPTTMGVVLMKSRPYGSRTGKRVLLKVTHGRVEPMPAVDARDYEAAMHAVAGQLAALRGRKGGTTR